MEALNLRLEGPHWTYIMLEGHIQSMSVFLYPTLWDDLDFGV